MNGTNNLNALSPKELGDKGEIAHNAKNYAEAYAYFTKAAERGNAYAQCMLGFYYENGYYVNKNESTAVRWYLKAAENGHSFAQYKIATFYERGRGGLRYDERSAAMWYKKAAEQGYKSAFFSLGEAYAYGRGVEKDYGEATNWCRKAAENGNAGAKKLLGDLERVLQDARPKYKAACDAWNAKNYSKAFNLLKEVFFLPEAKALLGQCYQYGLGTTKDLSMAIYYYESAARLNNAEGQYRLAYLYQNGISIVKNIDEARRLYEKGAANGHKGCKDALKQMEETANIQSYFQNGSKAYQDHDYQKAANWFQKGAELGDPRSQYFFSLLYQDGLGVQKDLSMMIYWLQKSANQGFEYAEYEMGAAYKDGIGVPKNDTTAFKWFEKAALKGLAKAQYALGMCYGNGHGTRVDLTKSFSWYKKAAIAGDMHAAYWVGFYYNTGLGVPYNKSEAVRWFKIAAQKGNQLAQKELRNYGLTW